MTIQNPSLQLIFYETSSPTTITVSKEYIVKNTIQFSEQLLNGLESSSNKVTLQLTKDCSAILPIAVGTPSILTTDSDIKAILKDGSNTLFTGYLSDNHNWTVSNTGKSALSITIEDIGTKLLPKPYVSSGGKVVFDETADSVITKICNVAGILKDANIPTVNVSVCKVVEAGDTCQNLLKSLVRELGYVYYFTREGRLSLKKIEYSTPSSSNVFDSSNLQVVSNKGLSLTKKIRQYKSAKVTYTSLKEKNNALVYKDISGKDDTHPDCNIPLNTGDTYPDTENGLPSYVEVTDLDAGKEIVYIKDNSISPSVSWSTGSGTHSIAKYGANTISVLVTCTNTGAISRLQATAGIKYIDSINEVVAGESVPSGSEESNNTLESECNWIHTKTAAESLAKLYVNYYKYCNRQFVFYSLVEKQCGTTVRVNDDSYSGISADLLIIGRNYKDSSGIYEYTGVSISQFGQIPLTSTSTHTPPTNINPTQGKEGKSAYQAAVEGGYTGTEAEFNRQLAEGGLEFKLKCTPSTLSKDKRSGQNQLLNLSAQVKGFINYHINYRFETNWIASEWTETLDSTLMEYYRFTLATSYESTKTYATKNGSKYTECVNLDSFEQGVDYYYVEKVYSYSSGVCELSFDAHSDSITIEIPFRNNYNKIVTAELYNKDSIMDVISLEVIEATSGWRYLGSFSSSPIDQNGLIVSGTYVNTYALEGDIYLDTSGSVIVPKMLDRNLSGTKLVDAVGTENYNEKVLALVPDIYNSSTDNRTTLEGYDFFKNLIADNVTANYIGSKNIQVLNGGSIYSGTIDPTQAWGERVTSSNGFLLDSTGNMEARNVYLKDVTAKNMTLDEDCTMGGELVNDVIKTNLQESSDPATYSSSSANKNPSAFLNSEAVSHIAVWARDNMTVGTKYSASGSMGISIAGVVYYLNSPPSSVSIYSKSSWSPESSTTTRASGTATCGMKIRIHGKQYCAYNFWRNWMTPYIKITIGSSTYTVVSHDSGSETWNQGWDASSVQGSFDKTYTIPQGSSWSVVVEGRDYTLNGEDGSLYIEERPGDIYSRGLNLFTNGSSTCYSPSSLFSGTYSTSVPSIRINNTTIFNFTISNPSSYPSSIHPLYSFSWTGTTPSPGSWSFFNSSSLTLTDDRGVNKNLTNWTAASWDNSMIKANTSNDSATLSSSSYVRSFSVSFQRQASVKAVYTKHIIPKDSLSDTWDIGNSTSLRYRNIYAQNVSTAKLTINGISYNLSVSGDRLVLTQ